MIHLRIPNRNVFPADFPGQQGVCQNLLCLAPLEPPYESARLCFPVGTLETVLCADCMPDSFDGGCPPMCLSVVEADAVLVPPGQPSAPRENAIVEVWSHQLRPEPICCNWGDWVFDRKELTLTHAIQGDVIALGGISSSAAILDSVCQVLHKGRAEAQTMYDLLRAFDAILSPQKNYCSHGFDKAADGIALASNYARRWEEQRLRQAQADPGPKFWRVHRRSIQVITSAAVGFLVEIHLSRPCGTGAGTESSYHIMPVFVPEAGAFWEWHLDNNAQFFRTPLEAASAFVQAFLRFQHGEG
jgi:hypothetical protein